MLGNVLCTDLANAGLSVLVYFCFPTSGMGRRTCVDVSKPWVDQLLRLACLRRARVCKQLAVCQASLPQDGCSLEASPAAHAER